MNQHIYNLVLIASLQLINSISFEPLHCSVLRARVLLKGELFICNLCLCICRRKALPLYDAATTLF